MKNFFKNIFFIFVLVGIITTKSNAQFYTGSHQEFGKNRVQNVSFYWQYLDFEKFRVFYYGYGKTNAEYVARSAHKGFQELEKKYQLELNDKIDILVYNRFSDFKQSNVGLTNDITSNVGGKTVLVGNKMFVYFEKDHSQFDSQIKSSISELIVSKMFYGGNWRQAMRSSATLNLPKWFTDGLHAYNGSNWNPEIDNYIKDAVLSGKLTKLSRLEGVEATRAGHSLWNYIGEVYGENVIPQIVYLVSVSRSFESSFRFVLGKTTKKLEKDWINYYKNKYQIEEQGKTTPSQQIINLKPKKTRGKITQYKISPNGNKIAYATNDLGKYKIWIYDLETKKYIKIARSGFKVNRKTDFSYPLLAWHPDGENLSYVEEKEGSVRLTVYSLKNKTREKVEIQKIAKILDYQYNDKGNQLVFSALLKGQIDIFLYNIVGNSYKQLTNDIYDDITPRFIDNSSRIIFSSNRFSDTLFKKVEVKPRNTKYDIFIYDLNKKYQRTLKRVTKTPLINEFQPMETEHLKFTYLADNNGIINRYLAVFDSVISSVDTIISYRYFSKSTLLTNYNRSILGMDYSKKNGTIGLLMLENNSYNLYLGKEKLDKNNTFNENETFNINENKNFIKKKSTVEIISIHKDSSEEKQINTTNYQFLEPHKRKVETNNSNLVFVNKTTESKEKLKEEKFKMPHSKLYNLNFTYDDVTSQLDKNFLNNSYQLYNPGLPVFNNPSLNVFNLIKIKDLMEDYRIIAGVNLGFNLKDNNYLISYENLFGRIDKKYLFVRQAYTNYVGNYPIRTKSFEFKHRLKYPFNEISAIGVTFSYRRDQTVFKSVDKQSAELENINRNIGGVKLEYIFDNTFSKGINLFNGTRLKLWAEFNNELLDKKTDFFVLGADIRHYQKIHRELIYAGRIATSTSFGNRKLVYYLGGVDGWFRPKFNDKTVMPTDKGFAFQTIATPMRGFIQNTRFGNSFAVINSELRWPVFKYFSEYPLQSNFLSTFQIVGFGDLGAAWTGSNPYSKENSFNKTEVYKKPILVTLENQREPILFGYGFGLRAKIFGYFVRYDWSWGVEDGVRQDRINYFSLSLDF